MSDDMDDLHLYEYEPDESPIKLPAVAPVSQESSMRARNGTVIRWAVHGDEILMTIAAGDGMATLTLDPSDGPLFADLTANALRQQGRNVRGA